MVAAGGRIAPAPTVQVLDAAGGRITTPVEVTATSSSSTVMLTGRRTVRAEDGVATFDSLVVVGRAGSGVISFSVPGLSTGYTIALNVAAGAPAGLALTRQPDSVATGGRLRVQPVVELRDAGDNLARESLVVQAELVGGGKLTGAITATAVSGRATFTDLGVDSVPAGGPRSLRFTVRGLTPAVSTPFTVRTTERSAIVLGPNAPVTLATWAGRAAPATTALTVTDGGLTRATGLTAVVVYGGVGTGGWLVATLDARSAPTVLRLGAQPGALPPGRYEATVRLTAAGVGGEAITGPVMLPVTMTVGAVAGTVSYGAPTGQLLLAPGARATPETRLVPAVEGGPLPADARVRYASRAPSVAVVDGGGAVTARAPGQTWVVATPSDSALLADSLLVTVTRAADTPLLTVEMPRTRLAPGERVEVPVVLDARGGRAVGAASLVVAWPVDATLGFLDLLSSSAGATGATVNAPNGAGYARVTFASAAGADGRVELARLVFRVRSGTSGRVGLMAVTPLAVIGADARDMTSAVEAISVPVASR